MVIPDVGALVPGGRSLAAQQAEKDGISVAVLDLANASYRADLGQASASGSRARAG